MNSASRGRFAIFAAAAISAGYVSSLTLHEGLWEDEATAVYIASSRGLSEFLQRQAAIDFSPPLFNAMLAVWGGLFGFGEVAVKTLALLLGALAAGAIALAAAEIFGSVAGCFAGALAVSNPTLIGMSTDVRPYSLSALGAALFFFFVFRARRRDIGGESTVMDFVLVGSSAVLTAASHYSGTIVVFVVGIFSLLASLSRRERRFWLRIAVPCAIAGLCFVPWLPVALKQVRTGLPWASRPRRQSTLTIVLFKSLSLLPGSPQAGGSRVALGLALAGAPFIASAHAARKEILRAAPAIVCLLGAIGASFFTIGMAGQVTRYITVPAALSAVLLGGAVGIACRAGRSESRFEGLLPLLGAILLAASALRVAVGTRSSFAAARRVGLSKSGVRDLCRDGSLRAGDLVVAVPDSLGPTLWYYAPAGIRLRGFIHWEHPEFADFSDYRSSWPDPGIVPRTVERIEADGPGVPGSRIVLISGLGATNNPLPFYTRDEELRAAVRARHRRLILHDYRGTSEGVRLEVFEGALSGVSVSGPV